MKLLSRTTGMVVLLVSIVCTSVDGQVVIEVPTDAGTIQAAIDLAADGDTVEVLPGTYVENINFLGKAITLRSADGPAVTTIDGSGCANGVGACSTITCQNGEQSTTVLEGFTVTGGLGTDVPSAGSVLVMGGGMYNREASPTVVDCVFTGNSVPRYGGGICNYGGESPTITNCEFTENVGWRGAGVCNLGSNAVVSNCAFTDNQGSSLDNRPSLSFGGSDAIISDCTFSGNLAYNGGGIFNAGSAPTISSCWFEDNMSFEIAGGGIMNYFDSDPLIVDCTFVQNRATGIGSVATGHGGAIGHLGAYGSTILGCSFFGNISEGEAGSGGGAIGSSSFDDQIWIEGCVFSGNSAVTSGGAIWLRFGPNWTVKNCSFSQNIAGNGSAIVNVGGTVAQIVNCALDGETISMSEFAAFTIQNCCNLGTAGIDGNFYADPQFADPDGLDDLAGTIDDDLHLLPTSPCIDSGLTTTSLATTDIDGQTRPNCGAIDIGADEFDGCGVQFVRGDGNADGAFDIGDPIAILDHLFGGGPAPCSDSQDANDDGAVNIGDPIFSLSHLFAGGTPPPAPHPNCGSDPTGDALGCGSYNSCP